MQLLTNDYWTTYSTVKCSSKTKKAYEESSIVNQCHQISRFFNVVSSTFRYPLRFRTSSLFVENHWGKFFVKNQSFQKILDTINQSGQPGYEQVLFLDERSHKFIQANLFHLESCKLIRKVSFSHAFLQFSHGLESLSIEF